MYGTRPDLGEIAKKHGARKPTWLTDAYHHHFGSGFYPSNMLEIGVQAGKSVRMWTEYFDRIDYYGLDLGLPADEDLPARALFVGDQGDPHVLHSVASSIQGPINLIVDDGSHFYRHQKLGVQTLWPYLARGGYYAVEDIGTSYIAKRYGGAFRSPGSTMEWLKDLADVLNCRWFHEPRLLKHFGGHDAIDKLTEFELSMVGEIDFITFHEGLCILKKRKEPREFLSDADLQLVTNTGPNKIT